MPYFIDTSEEAKKKANSITEKRVYGAPFLTLGFVQRSDNSTAALCQFETGYYFAGTNPMGSLDQPSVKTAKEKKLKSALTSTQ